MQKMRISVLQFHEADSSDSVALKATEKKSSKLSEKRDIFYFLNENLKKLSFNMHFMSLSTAWNFQISFYLFLKFILYS